MPIIFMKGKMEFGKGMIASLLIVVLMMCNPVGAIAQSQRASLLEANTPVLIRVNETFKADNKADNGIISAVVENDVYSADGSTILISKGTPASLEFSVEPNGSWGKAGRVCLSNATTKTVDNKRVFLRLSSCKNGGGRLGGVIVLSVLFFPIDASSG